MANPPCTCGHPWQEHQASEDDLDRHEGKCEVESCNCKRYEWEAWENYVDEVGYA